RWWWWWHALRVNRLGKVVRKRVRLVRGLGGTVGIVGLLMGIRIRRLTPLLVQSQFLRHVVHPKVIDGHFATARHVASLLLLLLFLLLLLLDHVLIRQGHDLGFGSRIGRSIGRCGLDLGWGC